MSLVMKGLCVSRFCVHVMVSAEPAANPNKT